ncbi:MAG: hypothetical protein K2Q23_17630 [Bryobacteraceae bacterium]|nr:hypothetical protein [Bryobacteraceae bacterium]
MPSSKASLPSRPPAQWTEFAAAALILASLSVAALWFCLDRGYVLYYGDAQAHLNIARRMIDSRTPGYEQIGTVWLPLPHLLALPLVGDNNWWRTGLAGAIPSAAAYLISGLFWFAAARRIFAARAAAWTALLVFALNPNILYLQATPMTELIQMAGLAALFWGLIAYTQDGARLALLTAAFGSLATTLTRYEGWFYIPFAALILLLAKRRWGPALVFGAIASLGPLHTLAYNQFYYSDALEFYRGPYSPRVQNGVYPGLGDLRTAVEFYLAAIRLNTGWPVLILGAAGMLAAVWRTRWILFLALPVAFYVWSMYGSGTPIFVPELWHGSYYNTRYGLAALPLLALGAGALAFRPWAAALLVAVSLGPWIADPRPDAWITWKESEVNSAERRAWTRQTAAYLQADYRPGAGILTSFGDLAGVYPLAGIPLAETLHEGNGPAWLAAVTLPEAFLREEWIVCLDGDKVCQAATRAKHRSLRRAFGKVRIYR